MIKTLIASFIVGCIIALYQVYLKNKKEQKLNKAYDSLHKTLDESIDNIYKRKAYPYVTFGWDGYPTILTEDWKVYPRDAEMIFNGKYYKDGDYKKNWPTDPETGEKLPIRPFNL